MDGTLSAVAQWNLKDLTLRSTELLYFPKVDMQIELSCILSLTNSAAAVT